MAWNRPKSAKKADFLGLHKVPVRSLLVQDILCELVFVITSLSEVAENAFVLSSLLDCKQHSFVAFSKMRHLFPDLSLVAAKGNDSPPFEVSCQHFSTVSTEDRIACLAPQKDTDCWELQDMSKKRGATGVD